MITGGCLCGKIRYEAEVELFLAIRCHCRDCQYVSGGEPAALVSFARGALTILMHERPWRFCASAIGIRFTKCGAMWIVTEFSGSAISGGASARAADRSSAATKKRSSAPNIRPLASRILRRRSTLCLSSAPAGASRSFRFRGSN